ncbi:MAG: tetratricopeptide repeat protein [Acidobacteriota bacterium]
MSGEQLKLFFKLYINPLAAMSQLIDKGRWLYGGLAVLVISLSIQFVIAAQTYSQLRVPFTRQVQPAAQPDNEHPASEEKSRTSDREIAPEAPEYYDEEGDAPLPPPDNRARLSAYLMQLLSPTGSWLTVVALALLYVPATILVISLLENIGSFGVAFNRDYGALLTCTLMAWAAAHLPLLVAGLLIVTLQKGWMVLWVVSLAAKLYFAALMVCALRIVCGARFSRAIGAVGVSWVAMLLQSMLWFLASPFLLFYLWRYFSNEAAGLGAIFSGRQSFRRNLEAAMLNPSDSEARYQLGLIYQQRRQYSEAKKYFQEAIAVNDRETDAHYQLGCIARQEGRLQDAINHFNTVVVQDDKHAHHEIWREIGATYLAAGMVEDAQTALERFVEHRLYDPEGLFHLGMTLQKQKRFEEAEAIFKRCAEAARTKLYDHSGQSRRWGRQAEKQLRSTQAPAT